jgi:hypothetical protein
MVISVRRHARTIGMFAALSIFTAWGAASAVAQDAKAPDKAPDYETIVAAPDRSDADRQADQRRQPARPTDEFVLKYQKPL